MIYKIQAYSGLLSMAVPLAVAFIRLRKTEVRYLPFLLLIGLGFLTEITSFAVVESGLPNLVIINVFVLLEALLITWQFRRWGLFSESRWPGVLYPALQVSYAAWWLYESFVLDTILNVNSYFILGSSFVIALMSIHVLTREAVFRSHLTKRNATYLISLGFLLYFTCAMLFEIFMLHGQNLSVQFRNLLVLSMAAVNCFTNLFYAYAIVCIPTTFRYLKQW